MKTHRSIAKIVSAVLCGLIIFLFSGCVLFDNPDGIAAVRERVEKLRYEMSETLVTAFKNNDAAAVKNLFCQKSQELEGIEDQIESTFSFMEGDIETYDASRSTPYEGYSNDYGHISEYSFGSSIFIDTDAGRQYELYFNVHYIALHPSIEGMTSYRLIERDKDYEERKTCRAGYGWSSPYDAECGIISAELIKAVADKDMAAVKSLLCEETLKSNTLDGEIQTIFEFFEGKPLFREREDGLYNYNEGEEGFSCRALGYEIERNDDGEITEVWLSVITQSVYTDAGKDYTICFTAYLQCDDKPSFKGVSYFSFEDHAADEEKQAGGWIH